MKISALPFYGKLADSERRTLLQNLQTISCSKGRIVRPDGDEAYGMVYVENGSVSVSLLSEEGREATLFRLRKGQACFLTAAETIPEIAFEVTLEAETDAKLRVLSDSCLSLLMQKSESFSEYVYRQIAENYSETVRILQTLLFNTVEQRLAAFLFRESADLKSDTLYLTHEQIARYIGSAREVITRVLKSFAERGVISGGRGYIKIVDRAALKMYI